MDYIGISDNKLKHIIAVARLMYEMSKDDGYDEEYCRKMFTLGYLHDIGYEFSKKGNEHPKVGSLLLKDYEFTKEIELHGKITEYSSYALDLLNKADLIINTRGENVGVNNRLEDIKHRYGKESHQYKNAVIIAKNLKLI